MKLIKTGFLASLLGLKLMEAEKKIMGLDLFSSTCRNGGVPADWAPRMGRRGWVHMEIDMGSTVIESHASGSTQIDV